MKTSVPLLFALGALALPASAIADDVGNVVITSQDDMGNEYRLMRLQYSIDDGPMLDVEAEPGSTVTLLDASLPAGTHRIHIRALYRGHGYGPTSKQRGMRFRSRSTHEFLVQAGVVTNIKAVWYEEGSFLTPLDERLALRYEVEAEGEPVAKPEPKPEPEPVVDEDPLAIPEAQLTEPETVDPEPAAAPEPVAIAAEAEVEKFEANEPVPEIDTVYFAWGKAKLKKKAKAELNELADLMKRDESLVLDVVGHTDSTGSARFNMRLSKRRAKRVVRYLVRKGVDRSRLQAVAKGEDAPSEDNTTAAGRRMNRRTELLAKRNERLDS